PTAEVAVIRTPAEEAILRYPAVRDRQTWGGPFVARLREEAFAALKGGLPNRRVEEWKYTDLRALMRELPERFDGHTEAMVDAAQKLAPFVRLPEATRFLFVNGRDFTSERADGCEW